MAIHSPLRRQSFQRLTGSRPRGPICPPHRSGIGGFCRTTRSNPSMCFSYATGNDGCSQKHSRREALASEADRDSRRAEAETRWARRGSTEPYGRHRSRLRRPGDSLLVTTPLASQSSRAGDCENETGGSVRLRGGGVWTRRSVPQGKRVLPMGSSIPPPSAGFGHIPHSSCRQLRATHAPSWRHRLDSQATAVHYGSREPAG